MPGIRSYINIFIDSKQHKIAIEWKDRTESKQLGVETHLVSEHAQ